MIENNVQRTKNEITTVRRAAFLACFFLIAGFVMAFCCITLKIKVWLSLPLTVAFLAASAYFSFLKMYSVNFYLLVQCDPYAFEAVLKLNEKKKDSKKNLLLKNIASFYKGDFDGCISCGEKLLKEFKLSEKHRQDVYARLMEAYFQLNNIEQSRKYYNLLNDRNKSAYKYCACHFDGLFEQELFCIDESEMNLKKQKRTFDLNLVSFAYQRLLCYKAMGEDERVREQCEKILALDNKTFMAVQARDIFSEMGCDVRNMPAASGNFYAGTANPANLTFNKIMKRIVASVAVVSAVAVGMAYNTTKRITTTDIISSTSVETIAISQIKMQKNRNLVSCDRLVPIYVKQITDDTLCYIYAYNVENSDTDFYILTVKRSLSTENEQYEFIDGTTIGGSLYMEKWIKYGSGENEVCRVVYKYGEPAYNSKKPKCNEFVYNDTDYSFIYIEEDENEFASTEQNEVVANFGGKASGRE